MKNATSKQSSINHNSQFDSIPTKRPTKTEDCLICLLTRHETTTYDANRVYGDSCLHTEISSIQKNRGILVGRVKKRVPNSRSNAAVAHYFLAGENRTLAMALVDKYRKHRNAEPINWLGDMSWAP